MASVPKSLNYLITGAGRGIGRGLTRLLLSEGNRVFLLDNNKDELQNTLKLAATWAHVGADKKENNFHGLVTDLSKRDEVTQAISIASKFFDGKLDVLVNNAMATPHVWADGKGMGDDVMDEWDAKIAVGLTAPFLLSHLCLPMLRAAGSGTRCIINMSSTRATQAEENHEGYSAVKAGILGLSQSMAVALGHRYGIRVNAIVPGWINVANECIEGDRNKAQWEDDLTSGHHEWHPARRVGKVEDVMRALKYLVESSFVTGEEIVVSGGVERKMVYPE